MRSAILAALLFPAAISTLGQETKTSPNTERIRPCTLHPVNGRICLSEGAFRGFVVQDVALKLPEGADENGEVLLLTTTLHREKP
jgi:hypothetical protein